MSRVQVVDQQGAVTGNFDLPAELFDGPIHEPVLHQALRRQLANGRQGTHDTKTRAEVRGGGRKPYKQKGTGRARQGSIRAPHYVGGGTVFGPTPRSYVQDMPRKQRRLALRSALAAAARDNQVLVLESFSLDAPRTRSVVELLRAVEAGKRVLFVLGSHNELLEKSARNLPEVRMILASNLNVRDVLMGETVIFTRDALEHLQGVLS